MSTQKVITVAIKASDQASGPIKRTIASIRSVGSSVLATARTVGSAAKGTASAAVAAARAAASTARVLTSLRTVMVGGLAALLAGRVVSSLRATVDELDELGERSKRLGIPAELMQTLEYEAKKANIESSRLFTTLGVGSRVLGDFARGRNDRVGVLLRQLGIDARDAKGNVLGIVDLLPKLQQAFATQGLGKGAQDSILAQLFGRGGPDVIGRLLASGNFGEATKRLKELGGIASREDVQRAQLLADAIDDLGVAYRGVKRELVAALGPAATSILQVFARELAKLPDSVRGIGLAIVESLGGGANGKIATELLDDLKANLLGALQTTAVELARAFGTALVAAVDYGLAAIGPRLADMLADNLGPTIKAVTLGAVDLPKSIAKQTQEARQELEELRRAAQVFADEQDNLLNNPRLDGADRRFAEQQLSAMQARLGGDPDQAVQRAKNAVDVLTAQLEQQSKARAAAAEAAFRDGVTATQRAWTDASSRISKEWSAVSYTLDDFADLYKQVNPETSEEAKQAEAGVNAFAQRIGEKLVRGVRTVRGWIGDLRDTVSSYAKAIADTVAANQALSDLELRRQAAFGGRANDNAVAMARLENAQSQERMRLAGQYGARSQELLATLREVQAAERQRLVIDQQLAAQTEAMAAAQDEYNAMLSRRAELVESGSMSEQIAQLGNANSQRRYIAQLREAKAAMEELAAAAGPNFAALVQPAIAGVGRELDLVAGKAEQASRGNWKQGIKDGIRQIREEASNLYGFAKGFVTELASSISSGLSNAFVDAIAGVRSLKDAMREFASSTLRMISQMILQFLVLRAVAGIMGSFGASESTIKGVTGQSGFGVPGQAGGRSVRHAGRGTGARMIPMAGLVPGRLALGGSARGYNGGGLVVGGANVNADTALIAAAAREYVVSRRGVRANGTAVMHHINAGGRVAPVGSGGAGGMQSGTTINVAVHMAGGSASVRDLAAVEQAAQRGVLKGLQQQPGFRAAMREGLR